MRATTAYQCRSLRLVQRVVLATFGLVATASAQSTAQFPVHFDFLNPGARSMALGGAFIAVADDASAAFTNPAGLAFMNRRFEVSFETRFKTVDTPYLAAGRISGAITGIGLDTTPDPVYRTDTDSRVGLTFGSFILPLKTRSTITLYGHEIADVENSFFSQGAFERVEFAGVTTDEGRDIPLGGTRSVRVANYGASIGYVIVDHKLAVGGGVSLHTFRLRSAFARHGFGSDIYGPVDTRVISATSTQSGNDHALGANVGAMWWPRSAWRVGATYRRGPRFTFQQEDKLLALDRTVSRTGHFNVPDVIGIGVARMFEHQQGTLTLVVDYNRVYHQQLKKDFINFQSVSSDRQDQLRLDNGNELHGGVEYRLSQFRGKGLKRELAFRAGGWLDSDHTVRYVPKTPPDSLDTRLAATLPGSERVVHYTFGGGVNWSTKLSVNVAADLSSRAKYATLSAEIAF